MFCDGCGATLQAGQSFCSKCGKQLLGPVPVSLAQPRGRVRDHIQLLGILWLAVSALNVLGGVILTIVANTIFSPGRGIAGPPAFLHPLLSTLGTLILAKAALGFFTGWGLTQREPWARVLALVLAFVSLFNVPFGTALGVYTLWVLMPATSEEEYEVLSSARAA